MMPHIMPIIDKDYVVKACGYVYCISRRKAIKTTLQHSRLQDS